MKNNILSIIAICISLFTGISVAPVVFGETDKATEVYRQIKANKLVITDDKTKGKVVIKIGKKGPAIILYSDSGESLVSLGVGNDGAMINMFTPNNEIHFGGMKDGRGILSISGKDGSWIALKSNVKVENKDPERDYFSPKKVTEYSGVFLQTEGRNPRVGIWKGKDKRMISLQGDQGISKIKGVR